MAYKYDLVLKNGYLVDPVNNQEGPADIGISAEKVAEVSPDIDPTQALDSFDLSGLHVVPGIIDLHVHASAWLGGRFGHKMLAQAGVTCALDMSGPVDSVLEIAAQYGTGLSLACLQYVRPGHTVGDTDPGEDELRALLVEAKAKGAYGFKILGGHYPLSPEATGRAIGVCHEQGAYLAYHAGSLATRSNLEGFHEAVQIIGDRPVHMAHINSYCRGRVKDCLVETEEAIAALKAHPNICSEAYLSPFNGTSAKCSQGQVESQVTVMCLEAGGFGTDESGLEAAILAGWAQVNMESGGRVILGYGQAAVDYWRSKDTDTTLSFAVNPEMPRIRLATAKRDDGEFVVDCISTDGGGIPRNVIVPMGLALVKLGALSLAGFAIKTSRNPAAILGLGGKGHLGVGADADVTVLDLERHRPAMAIAHGQVIMHKGHVCGRGGRIITSPQGESAVRSYNLEALVVDPAQTPLLSRYPN
jgi:dihydroorotase-like cyclic amidohydrolase